MMKAKITMLVIVSSALFEVTSSKLSLPTPSGAFKVGTVQTKLIDHNRVDPYAPDTQKRSLMIQFLYPAKHSDHYSVTPYMPEATAQYISQLHGLPNNTLQTIQTQAHLGAPIAHYNPPVVLFSHGLGATRYLYTSLLSDIASRGYLVVSIDHPYDAGIVEFPDGKVIKGTVSRNKTDDEANKALNVRSQDVKFVLDQLNTSKIRKQIPGLRNRLDVHQVAMFGHSFGGATTAAAMLNDNRIIAGANLDGSFWGPVVDKGLDRPFLIMSRSQRDRSTEASWAKIWPKLRSWRLQLQLANSNHFTYSDLPVVVNLLKLTSPSLEPIILYFVTSWILSCNNLTAGSQKFHLNIKLKYNLD
ncbi:hypothetical protein K7432_014783 [Basidiobolus ranarum]|uniref:1-alkyl-2-acetylglycerophosphocholine esterase n=1 Tax=Basidiobolus ranarum TaxID=34480 RepID=A0ABR2VP05_9FUNG